MWGFLRSWCVVGALLLICPSLSVAQEPKAEAPLMGSEAVPGDDVAVNASVDRDIEIPGQFGGTDGLFRILVIGDHLAGGFGAGVTRMVDGDERFEVVNRFNETSGLARPELYDWGQSTPKILATKEFDVLLVHVGVNDRQPMRGAEGRLEFRSGAWEAAYRQQIQAVLDAAKAANVEVFWLALPPMESAAFNSDMQYLNGLYRPIVTAKGGVFVDLQQNLSTPDGRYSDKGLDETGIARKLRSRDGIAFLKQGNNRMGQLILAAIKAEIAKDVETPEQEDVVVALDGGAPKTSLPQSLTTSAESDTPPQFGQQGLEGEAIAFTPEPESTTDTPMAQVTMTQGVGGAASSLPLRKLILATKGSQSEILLTQGLSPDPVGGRFDDFGTVAAP